MKKQSLEGRKLNHLTVVKPKPMEIDWTTVPYSGCEEVGRSAFEYEGEILKVIVRYFSYQRMRFEKERHFAEVTINNKEKFIIDGIEKDPLIQHISDITWPILECRKMLRQAKTTLKRIK